MLFSDESAFSAYQRFVSDRPGEFPRGILGQVAASAGAGAVARAARLECHHIFEQTVIPASLEERRFIALGLLTLCQRFPERTIFVKQRKLGGMPTTNPAIYDLSSLLRVATGGNLPRNLAFAEFPIAEALAQSAMTLTVSSTAAIESLAAGVPCAIISDLGIDERLANNYFIGSGCFRTFSEIDPDLPPRAADDWIRQHIGDAKNSIAGLAELLRDDNGYWMPRARSFWLTQGSLRNSS